MSRGIESIETVRPPASSETTMSVSVSAWLRCGPESMPISSTLIRSPGTGLGPGEGRSSSGLSGLGWGCWPVPPPGSEAPRSWKMLAKASLAR